MATIVAFVLGMGACSLYTSVAGPLDCTNSFDEWLRTNEKPCTELQRKIDADAAQEYYSDEISQARQEAHDEGFADGYQQACDDLSSTLNIEGFREVTRRMDC